MMPVLLQNALQDVHLLSWATQPSDLSLNEHYLGHVGTTSDCFIWSTYNTLTSIFAKGVEYCNRGGFRHLYNQRHKNLYTKQDMSDSNMTYDYCSLFWDFCMYWFAYVISYCNPAILLLYIIMNKE